MLNKPAKLLLVATGLSPVLGAVAINQIALGERWVEWLPWAGPAVILPLICWGIIVVVSKRSQAQSIKIKSFEVQDKEVIAYLLAYLLPFLAQENMSFKGEWVTGVYVLLLLLLVFTHANAVHFNPTMGLLQYHFYAIKDDFDGPKLLITREEIQQPGGTIRVAMLAPRICVQLKDKP